MNAHLGADLSVCGKLASLSAAAPTQGKVIRENNLVLFASVTKE